MTLDPQAAALLQRLAARNAPRLHEQSVAQARAGAYGFLELFGPPPTVAAVDHRFIPGPTADIPIRIYTPDGERPFAALIYLHGSGFVISNIGIFDSPSRHLANRTGCIVIAVNYQKAPEHKFPTGLDDAYSAFEWVHANADSLNVDPARIGVIGDSAGGTLATAICLKTRDFDGPPVWRQVLIHPPTQWDEVTPSMVDNAEGLLLETEAMFWFRDHYLDESQWMDPLAAPLRAESVTGLPPALVVTCEYDPLRDEGEMYGKRLRAAGVPTTITRYQGMIHGFYGTVEALDAAHYLYDEIAAFLLRDQD